MIAEDFQAHLKKIVERLRPSPLDEIGFLWQQDALARDPFTYIKDEYSPYLAHAVYAYLWRAIQNGKYILRLGSRDTQIEEGIESLDIFDMPAEKAIPYFLETLHYDKLLQEHVNVTQEGSVLIVEVK